MTAVANQFGHWSTRGLSHSGNYDGGHAGRQANLVQGNFDARREPPGWRWVDRLRRTRPWAAVFGPYIDWVTVVCVPPGVNAILDERECGLRLEDDTGYILTEETPAVVTKKLLLLLGVGQ